jgi:hypothetical protein
MKKSLAQILLAIFISLSIPLFSAYFDYHDLAEADFFACDMSFENSDQDNLSIDPQNESEVFLSSAFSVTCTLSLDLPGQLSRLSFIPCPLDQKTFTLRC